ncbi:MAG: alpha-glucosidase C-terminal domain-containing protein [Opitutales bacterium]|nr:alpha-glucosidase C-terminal domain-containing protein [Opitutales bacterium]
MKILSREHMQRIEQRFIRLYGEAETPRLIERLAMLVGRYGVGSNPQAPATRYNENDVVLITYADTIRESTETAPIGTFRRFCHTYLKNSISCVHLLPFFPWSSDDGFSVIDYREVEPTYGRWENVEAMAFEYSLMFDLVLNHCSSRSEWFADYVSGTAPASGYFHSVDKETDLSQVVRPRPWPLLTKVSTLRGNEWVWTTFSSDQIDLNWSNSDLLFEFLDILFLYISKGMRIVRLDAVAFLWKKIGTNCLHLPETHEVVKLFRDILDMVAPQVILLTETNVPHEENISYFGKGDEAHMVYNFSLPPLLLHALLTGNGSHLQRWARSLGQLPEGCTFLNFTASHDGIGVRPLQGILDDSELTGLVERMRSLGGKVNMRRMPDGSECPYELNITYVSALSDPADPALGEARFLCSQAVQLAFRGVPAVYIQSLLGTPNDLEGMARTGENRSINRRKWELAELESALADENNPQSRIFKRYTAYLRRRKGHPAFHPDAAMQICETEPRLFAFKREAVDASERIVCLHNLSAEPFKLRLADFDPALEVKDSSVRDILNSTTVKTGPRRYLTLPPYGCAWLVLK